MGQLRVANDAYGVLSTAAANTDTTLTLQSGQGARFPALTTGSGDWFYVTIIATSTGLKEVCQVTGASGDVLTVVRGVDGTTAQTFAAGCRVELRWNAAIVADLQNQMRSTMLAKMNQYLPVGMLAIYNGPATSIPTGWQLCDGTNGTPNLKDQIIIGAGITAAVGTTGGQTSLTLNINAMPAHNHTFTDTGHVHPVSETGHAHGISESPHSHQWDVELTSGSVVELLYGRSTTIDAYYSSSTSGANISFQASYANISINTATTGITMNNNGSATPIGTMPPYYAQAFIMKVATWV